MNRGIHRLKNSGSSIFRRLTLPRLRTKASTSWAAVQDTYLSTKDIFERHKVVFTVSTSIASVLTAWLGYSIRHYHETRVDHRLEAIESHMKSNYKIGDHEFKKLISNYVSIPASIATAGTTLVIGYGLGWRGGRWYQSRKFRKEQMRLLGQMKPKRSLLNFLAVLQQVEPRRSLLKFIRRPLTRRKLPESASVKSETVGKNVASSKNPKENQTVT